MTDLAQNGGAYLLPTRPPRHDQRALTIVAVDEAMTALALPIADRFGSRHSRTPVGFIDAGAGGAPELASRRLPWSLRPLLEASLKRTRTGVLLFAGEPTVKLEALRRAAYRRGCAIIVMLRDEVVDARSLAVRRERLGADWIFAHGRDRLNLCSDAGCVRVDGLCDPLGAMLDAIEPLFARQFRNVAFERKHGADAQAGALARTRTRTLERRFPALTTLDDLQRRLGNPRAILCLGNGPSSEDSALRDCGFDSLFRANRQWRDRGLLTLPDLVFTNLHDAVRDLRPRAGFVLRNRTDLRYMRHKLRWTLRQIHFANAEELGVDAHEFFGTHAPSMGALMLATAVALAPSKLIVGGIDFFSHAGGAYPGDRCTINDYTASHDRGLETAFVVACLKSFQGELVVHGEALKQALTEKA